MPDAGGVGAALASRLQKRGVEVLGIDGAPNGDELEKQIAGWKAEGPVHGIYWLPALDARVRCPTSILGTGARGSASA